MKEQWTLATDIVETVVTRMKHMIPFFFFWKDQQLDLYASFIFHFSLFHGNAIYISKNKKNENATYQTMKKWEIVCE